MEQDELDTVLAPVTKCAADFNAIQVPSLVGIVGEYPGMALVIESPLRHLQEHQFLEFTTLLLLLLRQVVGNKFVGLQLSAISNVLIQLFPLKID